MSIWADQLFPADVVLPDSSETQLDLKFKSSRQTGTLLTLLDSEGAALLVISIDNHRVS